MIGLLAVPLVLAALVARGGPGLATRTSPRLGSWLLTISAVVLGAATSGSLALLGWFAIADTRWVARLGDWSTAGLAQRTPIPIPLAAVGLGVLVFVLIAAMRGAVGSMRALAAAHRTIPIGSSRFAVIDTDEVQAYALPRHRNNPGTIVVTTGLFDVLGDSRLRRAVIEHERAHLRHHHHRFRFMVSVARHTNPFLGPVVRLLEETLERWADAEAAWRTDPTIVAHAIATVALSQTRRPTSHGFAATGSSVVRRVGHLLEPRRIHRVVPVAMVAAITTVSITAIGLACHRTETLFEILMR